MFFLELNTLPTIVGDADRQGRLDIRGLPLVTIDGPDARDFDDAVYCERNQGGWRLYIAIADVAYYVPPGGGIDLEAYARGTSVYFPDYVVPMLPEILSNGICSLRPKTDRLCILCLLDVSPSGRVTKQEFFEAVINSKARLTYDNVNSAVIDRVADERGKLSSAQR